MDIDFEPNLVTSITAVTMMLSYTFITSDGPLDIFIGFSGLLEPFPIIGISDGIFSNTR
jgi:hypothetical protein